MFMWQRQFFRGDIASVQYHVRYNNLGTRFVGAYIAAAQIEGWIMTR